MWARVIELMLGCWLAVSPFVFRHGDYALFWAADFAAALVVTSLALLSYWHPARHAHLLTAVVALGMIAFGWFVRSSGETEPALQNHIVIGLLLLMFAIVPNHASDPPTTWSTHNSQLRKAT